MMIDTDKCKHVNKKADWKPHLELFNVVIWNPWYS